MNETKNAHVGGEWLSNHFYVGGKLPSLNEYINACRSHWAVGAKMKKNVQKHIIACIRNDEYAEVCRPTTRPCIIHFTWFERTKRRDADNIASGKKFLLDAMQEAGILPNDNRKFVKGFTDEIIDADIDGVMVEIEEI